MAAFALSVFFLPATLSDAASSTNGISIEVNVQEVLTLDCGSATVNLGVVTPGIPVTGSSVCTTTTNAEGGYNLTVKKDDILGATLDINSEEATDIADKTPWDPAGTGNATQWSGTGLGFTVFASTATKNSAWWGTGTTVTDSNNKYAGFTPTDTDIMRHLAYSDTSTTTSIGYKLDVPRSQKSGTYAGSITYQAIVNP